MFQDKAVVITGAGRGIGRTLALGFGARGATVLVHYAHAEVGAREVTNQILANGGRAVIAQADLSKSEEVTRLVNDAYQALGPIDVWINNAGASANSRETRGMSEVEIFERMIGVDVHGTWRCSREAASFMRDGGCILTIGWDGALQGSSGFSHQMYALSKGAILSLTRSLAAEYAPRLRVNCIAPGMIENDWSRCLSEESRQKWVQQIPMKRWGTPEDVLQTALFLASASYITGQVILVNGGATMC